MTVVDSIGTVFLENIGRTYVDQNRQIVGISLPPATAKAFKEEAKRRKISVRKLFEELWAGYSPPAVQ